MQDSSIHGIQPGSIQAAKTASVESDHLQNNNKAAKDAVSNFQNQNVSNEKSRGVKLGDKLSI